MSDSPLYNITCGQMISCVQKSCIQIFGTLFQTRSSSEKEQGLLGVTPWKEVCHMYFAFNYYDVQASYQACCSYV